MTEFPDDDPVESDSYYFPAPPRKARKQPKAKAARIKIENVIHNNVTANTPADGGSDKSWFRKELVMPIVVGVILLLVATYWPARKETPPAKTPLEATTKSESPPNVAPDMNSTSSAIVGNPTPKMSGSGSGANSEVSNKEGAGSVTSTNQSGGITAAQVGNVTINE